MHFSIDVSNARLNVMNGLYVIDLLLHLPHVTIVFCMPKDNEFMKNNLPLNNRSIIEGCDFEYSEST